MKKSIVALSLAAVLIVLSNGCGGGGGIPGESPAVRFTGSITGYIYEPSGGAGRVAALSIGTIALADATVRCGDVEDVTDSTGSFNVIHVPNGLINCTVEKAGYNTVTFTATVTSGGQTTLSSNVLVAESGTYYVTASVTPASGTTRDKFYLSCLVEGGDMSIVEGRCSASESYIEVATVSSLKCEYTSAGSYTPGCRAGTATDDADSAVTVTTYTVSKP